MNNPPIKMIYQETPLDTPREVLVYDFMHETIETMQSFALCWLPSGNCWLTVPVAFLSPIEIKKKLNEDT